MIQRHGLGIWVVGLLLGLVGWRAASSADVGDVASLPAVVVGAAVAVDEGKERFQYVGSNKCKKCHLPEFKSWEKTKHAHALESLPAGKSDDAKKRAGLDPTVDYAQNAGCIKCHTTGFGEGGGYSIPDPKNAEAVKKVKPLEGVGCESCHGPGSAYLPIFEEITKSNRKYKIEELHAAGLRKIDAATCTSCHNTESPTFDASKPFDFERVRKESGQLHEVVELKLRAD